MTASPIAWYREISAKQWKALFAAQAGWMLDSMDFVIYLMAIPALRAEFGFGADVAGLLATAALLTSAAGGFLFGYLSDRFGRTRALMATIIVFSVCSLGSASAQTVGQLMLWRALLGFGMGGEWAAGATLVSETWPAEHRGKAIGIMQSGWAIGYILAALLAAWILPAFGWRWLFVVGVLPALLVIWIRRNVEEPEVWSQSVAARAGKSTPVSQLFKQPLLPRTAVAVLLSSTVMFAYWGLFSWLPSFLATPVASGGVGLGLVKSTGWIVTTQIGAFFGYISFGFISDRFGRKPTIFFFLVAAAIIVPIYGGMARSPLVLLLLGPLLGFFGHGYFSAFGALLAELFPTHIRGSAQGFCYNAGRALSAIAPFTIGAIAKTHGLGPALMMTSAFFVFGSVVVFFLPETKGQKLMTDKFDMPIETTLLPTSFTGEPVAQR